MARKVSQTTTDHDTIRRWVEERGGTPSQVGATAKGGQTGIIRIDFPGFSGEGRLEPIDWDEWFRKFDEANLAFVYEDETAGGERSNFNKLIGRETAQARAKGRRTSRRAERAGGARGGRTGATRARRSATGGARKASGTGRGGARKTARTGRGGSATRTSTGRGTARRSTTGRRQAATASVARSTTKRRGGAGA
jgi:hypothetical protein